MKKDIETTTLRLPKWLNDELRKESEYNGISKNALIIQKLKKEIKK